MALSAKSRAEIVDLIGYEADFERSGISGRIVRDATACPRQGDMPKDTYGLLMRQIGRGLVQYVVFSYTTPIAWVYTNGSVNLPDIRYSATTSTHQKMVREAFGDLVNHNLLPEPGGDETAVQLSENEEIILRRMRDEYGTEYPMVMGAGLVMGSKKAPRDQVEPLISKGLAEVRKGDSGTAYLTDKGRAHLDEIQPVVQQQDQISQYADLTVDELIDLASDLGGRVTASSTAVDSRRASLELVAVVGALKARNEASRPSRRRIGEYLRQQGILEAQYEKDMASNSNYAKRNAKQVNDVLDEVRSDIYAGMAMLKLSDLRSIVPTLVRDTKANFEIEQQRRLELWQAKGLPEKQAALLECIAKGHLTSHGGGSYSGDSTGTWRDDSRCKTCQRPDGRTMLALERKNVFSSIKPLGYSVGGQIVTLMLKDPEKTDQ